MRQVDFTTGVAVGVKVNVDVNVKVFVAVGGTGVLVGEGVFVGVFVFVGVLVGVEGCGIICKASTFALPSGLPEAALN